MDPYALLYQGLLYRSQQKEGRSNSSPVQHTKQHTKSSAALSTPALVFGSVPGPQQIPWQHPKHPLSSSFHQNEHRKGWNRTMQQAKEAALPTDSISILLHRGGQSQQHLLLGP